MKRDGVDAVRLAALLGAGAGWCLAAAADPPYLTGVVDDGESQVIEMPRLPGAWQRRIAWIADEGAEVAAGDLLVRLDPGDLIVEEETTRQDLVQRRLESERQLAQAALAILDAETAVAEADSAVRLAEIDAALPAGSVRQLDYERHQLTLSTAQNALRRAKEALANKRAEETAVTAHMARLVAKAQAEWRRRLDAIERTEISADRPGLFIHAESPFTGNKIFAGETLQPGAVLARVASRRALRFRFWVHEADIRRLPLGAALVVTPDAVPSLAIRATVEWTSKQAAERDNWSAGGYFELLAAPADDLPAELVPGMAVMAERG